MNTEHLILYHKKNTIEHIYSITIIDYDIDFFVEMYTQYEILYVWEYIPFNFKLDDLINSLKGILSGKAVWDGEDVDSQKFTTFTCFNESVKKIITTVNEILELSMFLSIADYATDKRIARRSGPDGSQEFFTPFSIIAKMCATVPEEKWNNCKADFLEPSFGNGNFIVYIIYKKIKHGSTWEQALSHTWGVELMEDNVKETHDRVINLLRKMDIEFNEYTAREIMKHNLVCSNFFDWDFDNWKPITKHVCEALF